MITKNQELHLSGNNEEVALLDLLLLFIEHKWKIAAFSTLFALVAAIGSILATPLYTASMLLQVETNPHNNLLSALTMPLMDMANSSSSATEIGLIKSRKIMGKTIDDLGLQNSEQEKKIPVIGKLLDLIHGKNEAHLSLTTFNVPDEYLGSALTLEVTSADSYRLKSNDTILLTGKVKEQASRGGFTLLIDAFSAPPGAVFILKKLSRLAVFHALSDKLTITESVKDSGLLTVALTGPDKKMLTNILDTIGHNYLQADIDRQAEETLQTLGFVNKLLPVAQNNLIKAERKLHDFQEANKSVDLPLEAKSVLESSVDIQSQQTELNFKKTEFSKLYTRDHPAYRALLEKEAVINKEKAKLAQHIQAMPQQQQEYLSIKRDVESGQEIYLHLLSKKQELDINKASTVSKIHIIDVAVAEEIPVGTPKRLFIVLGFISGLILSCGYILLMQLVRQPVKNSEQIETLGIEVIASIPRSEILLRHNRLHAHKRHARSSFWLAKENPEDITVEAIRSLRTSVSLALQQSNSRVLLLSSATPDVGKSFISSNLAAVIANAHKKVLLIDCDLYCGYLHEILGAREEKGISEILKGDLSPQDAVQDTGLEGLDFISRGRIASSDYDLFTRDELQQVIEWGRENYEVVIIDSPPIFAVADTSILARYAEVYFLVARYKKSHMKELSQAIRQFTRNDVVLNGIILNDVAASNNIDYHYGNYSRYRRDSNMKTRRFGYTTWRRS